jgi:hypothetical protein
MFMTTWDIWSTRNRYSKYFHNELTLLAKYQIVLFSVYLVKLIDTK